MDAGRPPGADPEECADIAGSPAGEASAKKHSVLLAVDVVVVFRCRPRPERLIGPPECVVGGRNISPATVAEDRHFRAEDGCLVR